EARCCHEARTLSPWSGAPSCFSAGVVATPRRLLSDVWRCSASGEPVAPRLRTSEPFGELLRRNCDQCCDVWSLCWQSILSAQRLVERRAKEGRSATPPLDCDRALERGRRDCSEPRWRRRTGGRRRSGLGTVSIQTRFWSV